MRKIILLLLTVLTVVSCASKKDIIYFQDSALLDETAITQAFEPIIEPNDILHIGVTAMDKDVVAPFQRKTGLENGASNSNPGLQGYLVDSEGMINFPGVGTFLVAGKSRAEIEEKLTELLSEYVKEVVVDVRIINFKVTVIGEVNTPGVYTVNDERLTLPQAIGLAGDFTSDGNRRDVTVIREIDGKRRVSRIDFTQTEFFNSPFYFLKQNDVVYVEPSLKGVKKSGFIPDVPALLSLFTIILSSIILLTR